MSRWREEGCKTLSAKCCTSRNQATALGKSATLEGGVIPPGFSLPLSAPFSPLLCRGTTIERLIVMSTTTQVALDPDKLYEIVDGRPDEKERHGARYSGICTRLLIRLGMYLQANWLGKLYPKTSFQIGANERIPDLAFVSAARIPSEGEPDTKWLMPPDLAVEVISPNDLYEKVYVKVMEYLAAGVKQVWLVSSEHHTITIYRSATHITAFAGDDELVSEDLLPGFHCPLRAIFTSSVQAMTLS
jgi:Uma2 family endonuclease